MNKALKIIPVSFFLMANTYAAAISCTYGVTHSCPEGYVCSKMDKDRDECVALPDKLIEVDFPFLKRQNIACYKSVVLDEETTHAYWSSRFAADLYSPYGTHAKIVSVFDGVVYTNTGCAPFDSQCGAWYGNSVKVIGDNGYMAFYAHLSQVKVQNGQRVKKGQVIGVEGATGGVGNAPVTSVNGFKHLHFSLHKFYEYASQYNNRPYPGLHSIPFKFKVKINGNKQSVDVRELPCHYKGPLETTLRRY
jgi:hypothetical protein